MENKYRKINIDNLKLDLQNPRLPKSKQNKDETSVIEFMLQEAATTELMLAIATNDFFEGELLLVVKDDHEEEKFLVIEGNRRLTATKLLSNPGLTSVKKVTVNEIAESAKFKPRELPCLVFEEKSEILKYLGFRHITGIKSWRLLEKSRYLYELKTRDFGELPFKEASAEIAKMIGSTSPYVKRLLISFQLYKKVEDEGFYDIEGLNDTRFYLNYFTDGLNKENIRSFLGIRLNKDEPLEDLQTDNLKEIIHWWFKKEEGKPRVYGDSNGLKLLDKVIGNKEALRAFRAGSKIEEAYELTDDLDIQFERTVKKSLKAIEDADRISNKVSKFYPEVVNDLRFIRNIALKLKTYREKLENDGDDF